MAETPDQRAAPQVPLSVLRRFFSSLSHDLRTPLTVIRNAVYFLRRSADHAPEISEFLDLIDVETADMVALLAQFNEVAEGHEPEPEAVNLEPLVAEVIAALDRGQNRTWKLDFRWRPPMVWCDRAQFRLVLHHLIRNAYSATKPGQEITVSAWQEPDFDVLEVRDTGPGVSEEVREILFEPLVSTRETAMGLGLTYCREVLRRHGGSIELAENSPAGAAFRARLPRALAGRPVSTGTSS